MLHELMTQASDEADRRGSDLLRRVLGLLGEDDTQACEYMVCLNFLAVEFAAIEKWLKHEACYEGGGLSEHDAENLHKRAFAIYQTQEYAIESVAPCDKCRGCLFKSSRKDELLFCDPKNLVKLPLTAWERDEAGCSANDGSEDYIQPGLILQPVRARVADREPLTAWEWD